DVRQGHASRLWQLLLREAQAALDKDNHLRVILVGSLAGGFGSATVADLAYLAHRAGQALKVEGGTSIEAYLATDGAFGRVANRPDVQAANTYASLRELERFQLAQGYPFRMVYRYEAAGDPQLGEVLAGAINRRLLDELYLFDTSPEIEPANEAQSQAYYEPAASIFPAMADAISLWLDKASRRGALNAYRRGIEADVTREQQARRRAVVGGLGTFVYRLPMYDLVAQLKARWARALLHQLVTGDPAAPLRLDAAQNREEDPRAIGDHVHQFLIGLAGYEQPPCPTTTALIGTLAHEGISLTLREKIGQTPPGQPEAEVPLYRSYLAGALQVILNGQASSQVSVARGGKLGYALDFLREVDGALARAAEEANLVPPDLPAEVSQALEQLFNLLPHLRAESQAIVATLQQQAGLLSRRLRGGRTAAEGAPGLLEQLEEWEAECTGRLAEMDAVLVRQYIHPAGLINQWYKTYLTDSPFVAEALQRLHWQVGPDGRLALAVRAWQTDSTILAASEANQRTFLDQLLQLAAYATQDIWQNETLATVLAQTALHPERIEDTVQRLRIGSEPLLRHNPDKASQAKLGVLLGVNETVDQAKRLEKALRTQLTSDRKLSGVAITDPYTLLLGQTIDVIPLDAIDSLANAEQTYHRWYGLLPNAPADPRAEPTAVFRAEKIALLLEQRLQPELRQAARLLRPVVVTALDSGGVARLYALALAAGWVQRTHTGLRLRLPGSPEAALGEQAGDQLHPYLLGLVQFAAQATPAQVRAIQTAVSQAGPETIEAWRTWAGPAWTQHPLAAELLAAGPDAADLAAVVALVTRDEVQRRN
ncbi:MAG: tubulin-like doman-containing protein, partial [Chloroflexota bacterium]